MRKTFQYRIFPTHKQATILDQTLGNCRWLYNHFLEQRKNTWKLEKKSLSRYDQSNTLKHLKEENPFLSNVYSQVQQNVCTRIDLAFRSFYRRVKSDAKPGYPRFRGAERYDSFTYPQAGFKLYENVIHLSKIGDIKIKLHRPIEGIVKTCTIKRMPTGKWFVNLSCNVEHTPIPRPIEPAIGIDMGLKQFAVLSNGEQYPNPRFFKQEERVLAKAQNRLSKQTKNTPKRHKAKKVVTRIHERIKNKRHNFAHQLARQLVNKFNTIIIEDLSINNMQNNNFKCINKSIGDAAWRMFLDCLRYKAECAGSLCIKVNPAYTSQTCSNCGNRKKLELSDRVYHCLSCGLQLDRDLNASLNILALGMQSIKKDRSLFYKSH